MSALTAQDVARAARRAAVTMASDPAVGHYSPETAGLVLAATVKGVTGAGDLATAATRIYDDPTIADVPHDVVEALVLASFQHFTRALVPASAPSVPASDVVARGPEPESHSPAAPAGGSQ